MLGNKVVLTLDAFVMSSKITFQETKNVLKGKNIFFFQKVPAASTLDVAKLMLTYTCITQRT